MMALDDLHLGLGSLSRLSHAVTRSISAENFTGEKGRGGTAIEGSNATAARELGRGWKVSPSITVPGNATVTLAQIQGPGAIQHIWLTVHPGAWRRIVLRMYWDDWVGAHLSADSVDTLRGKTISPRSGSGTRLSRTPPSPNCLTLTSWR